MHEQPKISSSLLTCDLSELAFTMGDGGVAGGGGALLFLVSVLGDIVWIWETDLDFPKMPGWSSVVETPDKEDWSWGEEKNF